MDPGDPSQTLNHHGKRHRRQKGDPRISKCPSGLPCPQYGPGKGLLMVPFPQQSLCPQHGDPLSNGKSTLESARG